MCFRILCEEWAQYVLCEAVVVMAEWIGFFLGFVLQYLWVAVFVVCSCKVRLHPILGMMHPENKTQSHGYGTIVSQMRYVSLNVCVHAKAIFRFFHVRTLVWNSSFTVEVKHGAGLLTATL
jgi:hypothetical protein